MSAIFVIILLFLYFLPTIIAVNRNHKNTPAIIIVNVFLGYTFVGWVVALAWAFTDNTKQKLEEED